MSKQIDTSLFIHSSTPRLYQRLLNGISDYYQLGNRITGEIKAAHAFRQVEKVEGLSKILLGIPIREHQLIAQYYLIWCECRKHKLDTKSLETVIEQTQTYKAKAILSRAAFEGYKGNTESELYFYSEALKASPSLSEYVDISRAIGVVKAKEGFHQSALKDLESLIPIVRYAEPLVYYDFLNSYAVELGEAGRLQEAANVSCMLSASPFVPYYPEWKETLSEVNQRLSKKRSTVRINLPSSEPEEVQPTAKILPFPVKPAIQDSPATEGFTPMHLLRFVLKSVFKEQVTDEQIDKACDVFYSTLQEWWPDEQA